MTKKRLIKNKKKIVIISILIVLLIIALVICFIFFDKPKEHEITLKYETKCENYNTWNNPDENGITLSGFSMSFYYNNLDDEKTYEEFMAIINFDTMENAKKYYNNMKEEYSEFELEVKQDDNGTPIITVYTLGVENEQPKKLIKQQKAEDGFTCKDYDTGRTIKIVD